MLPVLISVALAVVSAGGAGPLLDKQCTLPYKTVRDAWRSIKNDCSAFDGPSKFVVLVVFVSTCMQSKPSLRSNWARV